MFDLLFALMVTATVTGYAPSAGGINCDGNCGVTAAGLQPGPTIAACGDAWPIGAVLWVRRARRVVVCGDRFGPGAPRRAVDLWFATRQEALKWGRRESLIVSIGKVNLHRE